MEEGLGLHRILNGGKLIRDIRFEAAFYLFDFLHSVQLPVEHFLASQHRTSGHYRVLAASFVTLFRDCKIYFFHRLMLYPQTLQAVCDLPISIQLDLTLSVP